MVINKKNKGHHAMGDGISHNFVADKYVSRQDDVKTTLILELRKRKFSKTTICKDRKVLGNRFPR